MNTITISCDKNLLDKLLVYQFLTSSYWAKGRTLRSVQKSIDNSLCFGLYLNYKQIGFARVITDIATFGYIADVFVIESERGKGYSKLLMNAILGHTELKDIEQWYLMTKDAQGLYEQFGFKEFKVAQRTMMMASKPNLIKVES